MSNSEQSGQAVVLYTDGACRGNPGPGGWGVLMQYGQKRKELYGGEDQTTNNRMELMAAIAGLEARKRTCQVDIYTDSQYVRKGITEWIHGWKKNGWKTSAKKDVKNRDLWQRLDDSIARHRVSRHWVKGHAGHPGNERADALANLGIDDRSVRA